MSPPALVITRPLKDAIKLAAQLESFGYLPLMEPTLTIEIREKARPELLLAFEKPVQAILATSRYAVAALAKLTRVRDVPVLTVGQVTAAEAMQLGFSNVHAAQGNAENLAELAVKICDPGKGKLLYAAGRDIATDLSELLGVEGFETEKIIVYKAHAAEIIGAETVQALKNRTAKAVLFFSRRSAQIFLDLVHAQELSHTLGQLQAFCLSQPIAQGLRADDWAGIHVSPYPDTHTLVTKVRQEISADR